MLKCHCRTFFEMVSWLNLLVVSWEVLCLFFPIQLTSKLWSNVDNKWCYFLLPNNSFCERYQIAISFLWVNNFLLIKLEHKFPLCMTKFFWHFRIRCTEFSFPGI
jgi:hypothetical protein